MRVTNGEGVNMNKRRADLAPGDRIHNLTLLAPGMIVRCHGVEFTLGQKTDRAPAFCVLDEDGSVFELWPQPGVDMVFLGWSKEFLDRKPVTFTVTMG